jgi:uroporphyrinogen III methyltransferase/synthase
MVEALAASNVSLTQIAASALRFCAVGPATADALRGAGMPVHLVPGRFHAEGVVAALRGAEPVKASRILLPRAEEGNDTIPRELSRAGYVVDVVTAYETAPDLEESLRLASAVAAGEIDLLTFTAGSAARSFAEGWGLRGPLPNRVGIVAIGPTTAEGLTLIGMPAESVGDPHTLEGLVAAAERWAVSRTEGP